MSELCIRVVTHFFVKRGVEVASGVIFGICAQDKLFLTALILLLRKSRNIIGNTDLLCQFADVLLTVVFAIYIRDDSLQIR